MLPSPQEAPLHCYRHPGVETLLRCGRCGQPICVRCIVQTPVGARCPDCARLRRLPTYQVSLANYLVAGGLALGLGLGLGVAWTLFIAFFFRLGLLLLVGGLGVGYIIGEVTSLAVNRKRGAGLQAIAALGTVLSYGVALLFTGSGLLLSLYGLGAIAIGVYIAVSRLR